MVARAIWKGALSFGLINIPVNLYSATRERELKFTLLHKKDHSQIRYARICKAEEKEVPYNEIVKGYDIGDGEFVILTDEDFEKASLEKSKAIEIIYFTDADEIDSIYYDKLYYLEPGKNAQKAYVLLRDGLMKSKKVAVAKFILKNHEHLAIIKPHEGFLVLNQMRPHNEIVKPQIEVPEKSKIPEKEMTMALKLINQLTEKFRPEKFEDTYVEDLKALIKEKSEKGKIERKVTEAKPTKVHDIMSLLKESLEKPKPRKKAPAAKPRPHKRAV